jgi:5-(carboxyamino)imidazole ribonucleotide synthase
MVMKRNALKQRIGILGGGQLGRMMIEETLRMNIVFNILDAADSPCSRIANKHITGSLMDEQAINQLAAESDVLTYEIEHVNTQALLQQERQGKEVIPAASVLQIIQDKGLQKEFLAQHQIPTSEFRLVISEQEWVEAIQELNQPKLVAKSRKDGYDGKGVAIFDAEKVLQEKQMPFSAPSVIEKFVKCKKELSVMVARDRQGVSVCWPMVEMEFDEQANLVKYLFCPAQVAKQIEEQAKALAIKTVEVLNGVGVFAIEFFLSEEDELFVNEIAPRPHNSGHHTIEACYTSQFEQLVRILTGMPMGSTHLLQPAVMINLLGSADFSGTYQLEGLEEMLKIEGVYLHLYDKKESKPMRKMGHITILGNTLQEAKEKAGILSEKVKFVAE